MVQSKKKTIYDENSAEGILEILKEIHKYVPFSGDGEEKTFADQGVVGDQLTVEQAVNGHASLSNGFTPEECLDGLHFQIADWHAGNKFLQVNTCTCTCIIQLMLMGMFPSSNIL